MQKLDIGAVYKHYKGTKVKVLAEGFHSETLEPVVIYLHLEDGIVWVRSKKMFLEKVRLDNRKILRFEKVKSIIKIKPKIKKAK